MNENAESLAHVPLKSDARGWFESLRDRVCTAFLATGAVILYHDQAGDCEAAALRKKKSASKTKYTCPVCGLNAWAKPGVILICGECSEELESEQPEQGED